MSLEQGLLLSSAGLSGSSGVGGVEQRGRFGDRAGQQVRVAVLRCRRLDQVITSIEINASRAVRSIGDVRVDRAEDAVDVAVVVEADLHVVAPVVVLDEFSLEVSKGLEQGLC